MQPNRHRERDVNTLHPMQVALLHKAFEANLSARRAALAVGVNRNTAALHFRQWRAGRNAVPVEASEGPKLAIQLSPLAFKGVAVEAVKAGLSVPEMISGLIETIAEDNLYDAILGE